MFSDLNLGAALRYTEVNNSRIELTLLAVIQGVLITIKDYNLKPELEPTILYGMDVCKECVNNFPETGDPTLNFQWSRMKLQEAGKFFGEGAGNLYTAIILSQIASHIINDLSQKITNKTKLELLEPVEEMIQGLCDQLDPDGDAFDAYEEADNHLKNLYDLLGFKQ